MINHSHNGNYWYVFTLPLLGKFDLWFPSWKTIKRIKVIGLSLTRFCNNKVSWMMTVSNEHLPRLI
jgi:hypothetical protein